MDNDILLDNHTDDIIKEIKEFYKMDDLNDFGEKEGENNKYTKFELYDILQKVNDSIDQPLKIPKPLTEKNMEYEIIKKTLSSDDPKDSWRKFPENLIQIYK